MDDDLVLRVDGEPRELRLAPGRSLLWALREGLGLTGAKPGCLEGECGACSVLVDGAVVHACTTPVADVADRSVTTVEGLTADGVLHPVQAAFAEVGALQCGYCTPGMVVAAAALLADGVGADRDEIARRLDGNLCRCGGYPRIVEAVARAATAPARVAVPPAPPSPAELLPRPRAPWDLVGVDARDHFEVLGDGLVVVLPPAPVPDGAPRSTGGAWIHVDPHGAVTAFTGKVEVGQGTRRALRLLVARELDVATARVRVVMGDTDVCPFDLGTFGSRSMPTAAQDLRRAAAATRATLDRIDVRPGTRRVEVIAGDIPLTAPTDWPAVDERGLDDLVPAVTGARVFAGDVHRPGTRHGAVLRPPTPGSRLVAVDVEAARRVPGAQVVVDDGFVGVVAPDPMTAHAAVAAVVAEWDAPEWPEEADLEAYLRAHPVDAEGWAGTFDVAAGDVEVALASSAVRLEATYTTAYLAHAPLETRVALAEWDGDRLTVWTGTQQPFNGRRAIAAALGVEERAVRVLVPYTGAGFGGKHDPQVAIEAARLARAAGAPVQVRWTREEEFTHGYSRPAAVIDVRAGATSDGDLTAWEHVDVNAGSPGILPPYRVADRHLRYQPAASPLRQGAYRALAATANHFARESFVDELAHALDVDPLDLRLRNLRDERLAATLRAAAERFGWEQRPREPGYGAGLAVGLEKDGRVATCVELRAAGDDVELLRIVTAFDCGAVVDADNLRRQIQGATIMGLGGALHEAVHFGAGQILNPRFSQYRVPRASDVPPIEVLLLDRPDLASAGGGETPIVAVAPAIANALFVATGRRIRSLPLLGS